ALTGGDRISGERKFESRFSFQPYVRLLFSANHLPASLDATEAFFDRWLIVPFHNRFRGTKEEIRCRELNARLRDPKECSGLLNKALKVLPRLRQNGFTRSESMEQALEEYCKTANP